MKFIFLFLILLRCTFSESRLDYVNEYENDYCGIMIYKYGEDKSKLLLGAYKGYEAVNLGDYIQSIAASYFCGRKKEIYVDRDYIRYCKGPPIKMVMNGWWYLYDTTFYPSENIVPLYISFHIENQNIQLKSSLLHLKKHEPIGCRDISTMNFLQSIGIKAYFSGCLTLTLGLSYHNYADKINDTILCIVDCNSCEEGNIIWDVLMGNVIKYYNFSEVIYMTKHFSRYTTHYERFNEAYRLLKVYEKSTLVITSNLHTVLPCIAMDTPVIYVSNTDPDNRFSGYLNIMNYIFIAYENNKYYLKYSMSMNVTSHKKKKVYNSNSMDNYTELLIRTVSEFMN